MDALDMERPTHQPLDAEVCGTGMRRGWPCWDCEERNPGTESLGSWSSDACLREPVGAFVVEGGGDLEEGLHAGEVAAAFDGGELADADAAGFGEVFEGPFFLGAGEADLAAELDAEAVGGAEGGLAEAEGEGGLGECAAELVETEGLGEIIEDISLERLSHGIERWVAGDDDDAEFGPAAAEFFENFFAGRVAHLDVEEDDVWEATATRTPTPPTPTPTNSTNSTAPPTSVLLGGFDRGEEIVWSLGRGDRVAFGDEHVADVLAEVGVVVEGDD